MATNSRRRAVLTMVLSVAVPCLAAIGVGWLLVAPAESVVVAQPPAQPPAGPPDVAAGGTPAATIDLDAIQSEGPFACRTAKYLKAVGEKFGATKESTKAVAAALYWLAKHQMKDGNWSLEKYTRMCKDKSCTGVASVESLSAATALGLLPFFAAGQTQATNGPFQRTIQGGVCWLASHQKADGDLSADAASQMYSHGLATIALCEDYGMTHDKTVGIAAQKAVDFIEAAQNGKTGGWRYHPGEEGDMSVFGWQLAALKTAEMAGLTVKPATFDGAKKWLQSCAAVGADTGKYSYQPEGGATPTMSAVGALASQYLHAGRNDPVVLGSIQFLTSNPPDTANHNGYYWYYAAQVMHNMNDKYGDAWNQKARQILVDTQAREACAAGSWDPDKPNRDAWGPYGGRLMMTSLSCLTLEVSNRYLPVYIK